MLSEAEEERTLTVSTVLYTVPVSKLVYSTRGGNTLTPRESTVEDFHVILLLGTVPHDPPSRAFPYWVELSWCRPGAPEGGIFHWGWSDHEILYVLSE